MINPLLYPSYLQETDYSAVLSNPLLYRLRETLITLLLCFIYSVLYILSAGETDDLLCLILWFIPLRET